MVNRPQIILGIESSCDETAVAAVRADKTILAETLASQIDMHSVYGGVVPEVAARAHLQKAPYLVTECLKQAGITFRDVDAIAATSGPGLIGGVMIGAVMAKAMAAALDKPFMAINHLAGHALSPRLAADVTFPYLLLLISGGHCQLLVVESADKFRRLGTTIDDAAGEAFDKVAKLLGLGYPGGREIERVAANGTLGRFTLPVPMLGRAEANFSFSGLKTAARQQIEKLGTLTEQDVADIALALRQAITTSLIDRTARALTLCAEQNIKPTALVAAGGVASNASIRAQLTDLATQHGIPFVAPPPQLCTDNAAMIAWAGHERAALGLYDELDFAPRPRWPLDPQAEAVRGAGVKA